VIMHRVEKSFTYICNSHVYPVAISAETVFLEDENTFVIVEASHNSEDILKFL